MKSRFILCLALVLGGVLAGCATNKSAYPLPDAAFPEPGIYLVQPGDSASRIAKNLCLSMKQLSALNPGVDWSRLKIGLKLHYAPGASEPSIIFDNRPESGIPPEAKAQEAQYSGEPMKRNGTLTGSNKSTLASCLEMINSGSYQTRAMAVARVHEAFQTADENKEDLEIRGDIATLRGHILDGNTNPKDFDAYCKTVEILIGDFATALKADDKEEIRHYRFALRVIAASPYRRLEDWQPVEKELRSRQKWNKDKNRPGAKP